MDRRFVIAFAISLVLATVAPAQESVHGVTVTTGPEARQPSSVELWDSLMKGNRQFAAGQLTFSRLAIERSELRDHQHPPVTVLGCSDSRVPPELVFNQSLGSLFVIRTAGNIADEFGLASIEYAVANGYTKLILVLGHESCGAVKAALDHGEPGTAALDALVERIRMSFIGLEWNAKNTAVVRRAIEMNARAAAASLVARSQVIREAAFGGTLEIVPAYYDFDTGEVQRLD